MSGTVWAQKRRRGRQPSTWLPLYRIVAFAVACFIGLLSSRTVVAQTTAVPSELQAALLAKLGVYDRNFAARAGSTARVLLVVKSGNTKSALSAAMMKSALSRIDRIGGLPHEETVFAYETASALASACREQKIAAVYITPGFEQDVEAIRGALSGVDVLSVSATPEFVPRGIVLGFELVSGKPKILLNLPQAKEQNVDFKADVLRLMKVYR